MKTTRTGNRGLAYVAVAQLSATILGTVFWLLLARIIHPFAYGHLAWLISVGMIASAACLLGLGKTSVSYYPKERKEELLRGSAFVVLALSSAVGVAISLAIDPWLGPLIVGLSTFSIATYLELAKRDYRRYMWAWVSARSVALVLPIAIYCAWGMVDGILLGLSMAYLVAGFLSLRRFPPVPNLRAVCDKLRFTGGSWGADIAGVSANFLDKILIGTLFGWTVLGTYQFAYRIFLLFAVFPQILFFYLLPEKSAEREVRRIELLGVLLSVGLAGLVYLSAPLAIPRIFPDFTDGTRAVQVMGLAIIPLVIAKIRTSEFYSQGRASVIFGSNLIALSVGVTGIAISFRRSLGLLGLSWSLLALQTALALALFSLPKILRWQGGSKTAAGLVLMMLSTAALLGFAGAGQPQMVFHQKLEGENLWRITGKGIAMDTYVKIIGVGENPREIRTAIDRGFGEIRRVEELMSAEDEDSEIYALNHSGGEWVDLSPETLYVLEEAKRYAEISDGLFDPTVKPLVDLWMEKVRETGKIPDPTELREELELVEWRSLVIDANEGRARFLKSGMQITLGGIAKGYAVDRACEILMSSGVVERALVDIGGDIRVVGKGSWTIGVQHPRHEHLYIKIELENCAVASSGDYQRFFFLGVRIHHIIDPRTGCPADESAGTTVIAETCTAADALSTAVFVAGPEDGRELLDSLGLKGLIVTRDEETIASSLWDFPLEWEPL